MNEQYTVPIDCPFCGSDDIELIHQNIKLVEGDVSMSWVTCNDCEAHGPVTGDDPSSIKGWNDTLRNDGKSIPSWLIENIKSRIDWYERQRSKFTNFLDPVYEAKIEILEDLLPEE
jgi:Lar family restriction alleviation protein